MRKFYLLIIVILVLSYSSCNQSPKSTTANSTKGKAIDSLKYIPQSIGWTNDFYHLFSKKEIESLDSLISSYEKKTSVQFAIATIDSFMLGPIEFEPYTLLMSRTWGVGAKKKNNGILIVLAPDLRRIRIQNGYGIEKILSNEETKNIIDSVFIPKFRENKFFIGTKEGILAIIKKLDQNSIR